MNKIKKYLNFIKEAEEFKNILRHSWNNKGRRISAAEHTWMTSLMAIILYSEISLKINLSKVLKMIIIHSLLMFC